MLINNSSTVLAARPLMPSDCWLMPSRWSMLAGSVLSLCASLCFLSDALAQSSDLRVKSGLSLGVSLSKYKYSEPGFMTLDGNKLGMDLAATYVLDSAWPRSNESWVLRGEMHFKSGKVDYNSNLTGQMNGKDDHYLEGRALIGREYDLGTYALTPYLGIGTRQLRNDLRGFSSTGRPGYRRENRLSYLPFGMTSKLKLNNGKPLHSTVEYRHLLRGLQDARLSDSSALESDVRLKQGGGFGLYTQFMLQLGTLSVGPTLSYWQLDQSDPVGAYSEPRNKTYEFGLKLAYQF